MALPMTTQNSLMSVFCFVSGFTSQSTAMVMLKWLVHLTTHFSWARLTKQLTSTLCTYFRLKLSTTLLETAKEENYFMIKLHQSMGPGQNGTRDPWICSWTHYRLSYRAAALKSTTGLQFLYISQQMRFKYLLYHSAPKAQMSLCSLARAFASPKHEVWQ